MKSLVTFFAIALFSSASFAQSFELIDPPTGLLSVDKSLEEKKFYINVKNTSNDTLSLLAYRIENLMASGADTTHLTYFCWDLCYGVNGSQSIEGIKLAPGDTLNRPGAVDQQYVAFLPGDIDGYSRTTMKIVNAADATDFLDVVFEFSVGGATNSITDAALAEKTLSNPYPNPVKDRFSVDYDLPLGQNATLSLYNLIGKEVLRQAISGGTGTAEMEVATLPRGVYFLHLTTSAQPLSSRRVILR
ncbi:MAG: T9SS type A sorting domain-containing protein [Bacteroidia bacterium]|nr:T9SS type A sorting domain-containing protein [Bacteroidia bacterium]